MKANQAGGKGLRGQRAPANAALQPHFTRPDEFGDASGEGADSEANHRVGQCVARANE